MSVEHISESEIVKGNPPEVEESFQSLSSGDTVIVYAWGGGDEYVKGKFTVERTRHSKDASDDYVYGSLNGTQAKLHLPWCPAEKNVGIPHPYPEGPVQLKINSKSYDVYELEN